ncbi:MAG: PfaD family polyunsaturated fatty acid/polyketide biosynthesis protein [Gemmataceae bacterium]|nr:PfaD family polyunsaturated fatty acid/polyketide biosynthesis protein [Gemmataceae bacterium]
MTCDRRAGAIGKAIPCPVNYEFRSIRNAWPSMLLNQPETAAEPVAESLLHSPERPLWYAGGQWWDAEPRARADAYVPAVRPGQLGDAAFRQAHGLKFAYVAGSMANGIASVELVEAMSRAGMLGFFGAAGLSVDRVTAAVDDLRRRLHDRPFGCNLIHSPHEPATEAAVAAMLIRRGVRLVEASAFLDLTLPIVKYRLHGIRRGQDGRVIAPNRVVAKVSRVEVASKFLAPAPDRFIRELVESGDLSRDQAELAREIPVAHDLTAEADSGGHTDNRPLVTLLPTLVAVRDRMQEKYGYAEALRVGAAGGIATPAGVAAAFALGAAYVVTGSINQACIESGSSPGVRQMLAEAGQADVVMAPAADMFEMGVKVQVLKRGTMFPMRAGRLFELYRGYESLEAIPAADRARLETEIFRKPIAEVWEETRQFWAGRDARQLARAETDPRHKMALVFRWYLGLSSRWANAGQMDRRMDFQVWAGPALGAFNEWTAGSFLEKPENRRVAPVARALLFGAAVQTRIQFARAQGVNVSPAVARVPPREVDVLD